MHYYGQRYYNQDVGRFTSQDPVFLAGGTNDKRAKFALQNPQLLNAYSYTANNPLKYVDEEGEFLETFADVGFVATDIRNVSAGLIVGAYGLATDNKQLRERGLNFAQSSALNLFADTGATAVPFLPAGFLRLGNAGDAAKALNKLPDDALVCRGGGCSPESFIKGNNGALNQGKLIDVSVQSYPNTPLSYLIESLKTPSGNPYGSVGYTTVGNIRKIGGDVIHTPTPTNPFHSSFSGTTPEAASDIMKVIPNPFKR